MIVLVPHCYIYELFITYKVNKVLCNVWSATKTAKLFMSQIAIFIRRQK